MISVIIPMYNSEQSIVKCLDSVKAQTWTGNFEIIIVNDGSTDLGTEVVQDYMARNPGLDITLIHQHNQGVSKARNVAMERSKGDYIALLDADDEWLPDKTEAQMKILTDESLEVDFLTTLWNRERVRFPYRINDSNLVQINLKKLLLQVTGQTSTAIFRRDILENTGFFDEKQRYSEDANYWMRVTEHNRMFLLPDVFVFAGNGKKSFGASGLSANLEGMEKGIQKNLSEMYTSGRINLAEYLFYFVFSKIKYWFRPVRARL